MDEGIGFFYESQKCSRQVAVLSEWRLLGLFKNYFVKSSGALSSLMDVIFSEFRMGMGVQSIWMVMPYITMITRYTIHDTREKRI